MRLFWERRHLQLMARDAEYHRGLAEGYEYLSEEMSSLVFRAIDRDGYCGGTRVADIRDDPRAVKWQWEVESSAGWAERMLRGGPAPSAYQRRPRVKPIAEPTKATRQVFVLPAGDVRPTLPPVTINAHGIGARHPGEHRFTWMKRKGLTG